MFLQPRQGTTDFSAYAVEFSPFHEHWVAVGTSQYFGIIGNGQQHVMEMLPTGELAPLRCFDTQDGVYDVAWSETHPNQLVSGCANGHLKLFDVTTQDAFPIQSYTEHTAEIGGVNWNLVERQTFCSASWDQTIKIWHPHRVQSLQTLHGHTGPVYNAVWSTRDTNMVASCSGDGSVRLWDLNAPQQAVVRIPAHAQEVLALDWNKYNPNLVVSGSVDASIKVWDIRNPSMELRLLRGHNYAVRRVKCSPHDEHVIGSTSYDMSVRLWNTQAVHPHVQCANHHTEFVLGLDFSLFVPGLIASCSWDRRVVIWNHTGGPPTI
ncbi:hypothetical protein LEN26_007759 [Aphanomyces euteiches]|nr:hypothetical protein AeMF1_018384 [Aphanomyces euteiches]KAH9131295.1 hypothetical protein LEN26_007759 [Aphanomyces euteiches]KAH9191073.1 hypothetical protein AeNC1_006950 [Aphanomyces euteiches]